MTQESGSQGSCRHDQETTRLKVLFHKDGELFGAMTTDTKSFRVSRDPADKIASVKMIPERLYSAA